MKTLSWQRDYRATSKWKDGDEHVSTRLAILEDIRQVNAKNANAKHPDGTYKPSLTGFERIARSTFIPWAERRKSEWAATVRRIMASVEPDQPTDGVGSIESGNLQVPNLQQHDSGIA